MSDIRTSESHLGITAHGHAIHRKPEREGVPGPTACGIRAVIWYRLSENPDFVRRMGRALCQRCFKEDR